MLKHGTAYAAQSAEQYEKEYRERTLRRLKRQAAELGLELVEKQPA
jgi:hypothetical protein